MSDTPTQWYIRLDGVVHGPASAAQLKSLVDAKRITAQTEASRDQNGPWRPLAQYAEFAPVHPISELFAGGGAGAAAAPAVAPAAAPTIVPQAPVAMRAPAIAPAPGPVPAATAGALTPTARKEFSDGLAAEVRSSIENKAYPASFVVGGVAFFAIAGFSMIAAFIVGLVVASIAFNVVKSILEGKYLRPISEYSDEMLVTRYNEAKADRRAARTRSAIGWAVIVIIGVLLLIAWMAAKFQMRTQ
ncbi:MAG TPA: DUF4339 domain-containing protein [Candidatus Acidoferrum sp.]|nr:DUF4339 domain-containing protein [Candidatus Acidoferrum sp.]